MIDAPSALGERARGLLFGAAVGDALGWPQEQRSQIVGGHAAHSASPETSFRRWVRYGGGRFARYEDVVEAGDYSDDTQLLLAVGRACAEGSSWLAHLTDVELPAWPVYQRGGGRAVLAAAGSWQRSIAPWLAGDEEQLRRYFSAGANGVAMRIGPHALVTAAHAHPDTLVHRVIQDGVTTHGHPRAIIGGIIHALALRNALLRQGTMGYGDFVMDILDSSAWRDLELTQSALPQGWLESFSTVLGESFERSWRRTVSEVDALLDIAMKALGKAAFADDHSTLAELGCFDSKRNGSGTITAVASVYLAARAAAQPATGLLRAAFLDKADTDTLASMTASLLGAVHGIEWMNGLAKSVQDRTYIDSLASFLTRLAINPSFQSGLEDADFKLLSPNASGPVGLVQVKKWMGRVDAGVSAPSHFVDGRQISSHQSWSLSTKTSNVVTRHQLTLQDGQTLVVDKIVRRGRNQEGKRGEGSGQSLGDRRDLSGEQSRPESNIAATDNSTIISRVAIPVRDLRASRQFYQRTLGIEGQSGEGSDSYFLTKWLVLVHRPSSDVGLHSAPNVRITLYSGNLTEIVRRISDSKIGYSGLLADDGRLVGVRLQDPDGNEIVLRQG